MSARLFMKVRIWPKGELGNLFILDDRGSFLANYQSSTGSDMTIVMNYDGIPVQHVIPLSNILMYTLMEEENDRET